MLSQAKLPYKVLFKGLLERNTFCGHADHSNSNVTNNQGLALVTASVEILSLECAFDWLRLSYPDTYTALASFVSELEDEPNPPRWEVLAEDFGNVYWTIWIFVVCLVRDFDDGEGFYEHPHLEQWISRMRK